MKPSDPKEKPSDSIKRIMADRDEQLCINPTSGLPMYGALWAVIEYLDEQAKLGEVK